MDSSVTCQQFAIMCQSGQMCVFFKDGISPVRIVDPSENFRPEIVARDAGWNFRKFEENVNDPHLQKVFKTYTDMHTLQCMQYVKERNDHWGKFDKFEATIMEALEMLNNLIDESDPDIDLPNIIHAFQTAERIRKEHPDTDWFHLVGLIHDLGKAMALFGEPQFSTVGDTFPVGCEFASSIVFRNSTFHNNPDIDNPKFNTKYGIYEPNCGLSNVRMSWGHDEYMYRVLVNHGTSLPEEALYIIRFHSFYPWHTGGDYWHLCDNKDHEMHPWIKEFNKFDLYTKREKIPDIDKLRPYYESLITKYIPGKVKF